MQRTMMSSRKWRPWKSAAALVHSLTVPTPPYHLRHYHIVGQTRFIERTLGLAA